MTTAAKAPVAAAAPVSPWRQRFRAARVSLPRWAQDAPQRTSYSTNASGIWQVVSWDRAADDAPDATGAAHRTLTDKATGVAGGRPLPDGSGVVWFDDGDGDEFGRYVVTPFTGGAATALVTEVADGWGAGVSLRTGRTVVGMSDREGSRVVVVDDGGVRTVYTHAQPADVGGLSRDAALLAISHSEHGDILHPALRVLDAATGATVANVWDGAGNTIYPAGWSPIAGDARMAILSDRGGRFTPELWHPLTGQRDPLDIDLPGEVGVADWWPDGQSLLLAHDYLGRTELFRHDLSTGATTRLDLPVGTIAGAAIRDDGAIWYAFTSSAAPSQVRVRDDAGDRLLLSPPGEPAPAGRVYTSLHYDNGLGDKVHAFLATPPGDGPFPLLVDAHGGPQAHYTDSFEARTQAWVDHGFAVLKPNYRGSTGYGKAWQDFLEGNPGFPELVDLRAGRDHLVAAGIADPDVVVLEGGSWGGYLALLGVGWQPDAWSAGIAFVPVADYVAAFEDESPVLQEVDRMLFGGTPDEVGDLYLERSPLTYVDAVRAPVLIVTGANDTRCPQRQVDNYVAALIQRDLVHHYDIFDAGHGSMAVDETIRQVALALDFLATHLGTPAAQP